MAIHLIALAIFAVPGAVGECNPDNIGTCADVVDVQMVQWSMQRRARDKIAKEPRAASPIEDPTEAFCEGGWQHGDGTGGSETKVGTANSYDQCIEMVLSDSRCSNANGATIASGGSGGCYCEVGQTGHNDSPTYENCKFRPPAASPEGPTEPPTASPEGPTEPPTGSPEGPTEVTCELGCTRCGFNWYYKNWQNGNPTENWQYPCGCCGGTQQQQDTCKIACVQSTTTTTSKPWAMVFCEGGWQQGEGTGGSKIDLGTANSYAECLDRALIDNRCGENYANGATIASGGSGVCYCELQQTGRNDNANYENCKYPAWW